jgi:hypothetical protein
MTFSCQTDPVSTCDEEAPQCGWVTNSNRVPFQWKYFKGIIRPDLIVNEPYHLFLLLKTYFFTKMISLK